MGKEETVGQSCHSIVPKQHNDPKHSIKAVTELQCIILIEQSDIMERCQVIHSNKTVTNKAGGIYHTIVMIYVLHIKTTQGNYYSDVVSSTHNEVTH